MELRGETVIHPLGFACLGKTCFAHRHCIAPRRQREVIAAIACRQGGFSAGTHFGTGDGAAGGQLAYTSADGASAGIEMRVVVADGELIGRIGAELVEKRRESLHGNGVAGRMKSEDAQPAVASVGKRLVIREDLVLLRGCIAQVCAMR